MLVGLPSCHAPFAPPEGAYAIAAPAEYAAAWAAVEQCAERRGLFERIQWHAVPDSAIPCPSGECSGVWYPPHDIYVTEENVHEPSYFVVRHEMLHDLLQVADHPALFCTCGLGGKDPANGSCPAR